MLVLLALKSSRLDCELRVLEDGGRAVNFIDGFDANSNAGPIDLLLLDMHLPKRDGGEILKRLRSRDHAQAQKHAARHYFRKPSSGLGNDASPHSSRRAIRLSFRRRDGSSQSRIQLVGPSAFGKPDDWPRSLKTAVSLSSTRCIPGGWAGARKCVCGPLADKVSKKRRAEFHRRRTTVDAHGRLPGLPTRGFPGR